MVSKLMSTKQRLALALMLLGSPVATWAQSALEMGSDIIRHGTTIEVLGPGPDLQVLIDAIGDAAADKPYLIKLAAGEYPVSAAVIMQPYVSIMGSGPGVTVLKGAIISGASGPNAAIVAGAAHAALTDLSIENTGGGQKAIGLYSGLGSPRIERVTIEVSGGASDNFGVFIASGSPRISHVMTSASGGNFNYGVINLSSTDSSLSHVTAKATGPFRNYGVFTKGNSSNLVHVIAEASEGVDSYGVYNEESSPTLTAVTATAFMASSANVGVYNWTSSSPTMSRLTAKGTGAGSYGVYSVDATVVQSVDSSVLTGGTAALRFGGNANTRIANTSVFGGVHNDAGGTAQCGGVYDENLSLLTC